MDQAVFSQTADSSNVAAAGDDGGVGEAAVALCAGKVLDFTFANDSNITTVAVITAAAAAALQEENFDEALKSAFHAWTRPSTRKDALQQVAVHDNKVLQQGCCILHIAVAVPLAGASCCCAAYLMPLLLLLLLLWLCSV
jgi:hypothetical protein